MTSMRVRAMVAATFLLSFSAMGAVAQMQSHMADADSARAEETQTRGRR